MNDAHLHLVVNHLPIIFPIAGVIILIVGFIFKSEAVKRTAFFIFILGALAAIAAMSTGEGAEEVVEKINDVTENFIEKHEETSETFAIISYVLGAISLLGFWASFKGRAFSNSIGILTLVLAMVTLFFAKQSGTTGGEIRHTEIRADYSATPAENGNTEKDDD